MQTFQGTRRTKQAPTSLRSLTPTKLCPRPDHSLPAVSCSLCSPSCWPIPNPFPAVSPLLSFPWFLSRHREFEKLPSLEWWLTKTQDQNHALLPASTARNGWSHDLQRWSGSSAGHWDTKCLFSHIMSSRCGHVLARTAFFTSESMGNTVSLTDWLRPCRCFDPSLWRACRQAHIYLHPFPQALGWEQGCKVEENTVLDLSHFYSTALDFKIQSPGVVWDDPSPPRMPTGGPWGRVQEKKPSFVCRRF